MNGWRTFFPGYTKWIAIRYRDGRKANWPPLIAKEMQSSLGNLLVAVIRNKQVCFLFFQFHFHVKLTQSYVGIVSIEPKALMCEIPGAIVTRTETLAREHFFVSFRLRRNYIFRAQLCVNGDHFCSVSRPFVIVLPDIHIFVEIFSENVTIFISCVLNIYHSHQTGSLFIFRFISIRMPWRNH